MIRRDFIKTAGAALASTALPGAHAFADGQVAPGRMILPINRNWRYHPSKVSGAESTSFDDSQFARVVIPHTNIELPWHSFDDKDYEFISAYRRRFMLPEGAAGKKVFVEALNERHVRAWKARHHEKRLLGGCLQSDFG